MKRFLVLSFLILGFAPKGQALTDFLTDHPKLVVELDDAAFNDLTSEEKEKTLRAKDLIPQLYEDWQTRFGTIRRHLRIRLVPSRQEIDIQGARAEGVWSWQSFNNEEGTAVLGISGNLFVNLNSKIISQDALLAHETSHAMLITYQPRLLETGNDFKIFNEGLAELFSIRYETNPWRNWSQLVTAHRHKETFQLSTLSSYGMRIFNVLTGKAKLPHDLGFFYLFIVRNGQVDLDKDLKETTNDKLFAELQEWLKKNPDTVDFEMIRE